MVLPWRLATRRLLVAARLRTSRFGHSGVATLLQQRGMASSQGAQGSAASEQAADPTAETTGSGENTGRAKEPKTFTPRELYQASIESHAARDKAKTAASASLALGGVGVLVWHHWATLATFNCLGGGLLLLSAAMAPRPHRAFGGDREDKETRLKLKLLNNSERWKADEKALQELLGVVAPPAALVKAHGEEEKEEGKQLKEALTQRNEEIQEALKAGETVASIQARLRPKTFVFDFQPAMTGMVRPEGMKKQLEDLRDIVTFILHTAKSPHDQVVVRIGSPGGMVADYGLAASQLLRLRSKGLTLTACVDKVAASGGYMMACAADTVVATPFSLVGSIGVLSATPNFSKVLKRHDIDFIQITAGKWKRTVDPFAEVTPEAREKAQEDVQIIHEAFKGMVQEQRHGLDVDQVATGEVFLGAEAKSKGLVDRLATSDEVLEEFMNVSDVIEVSIAPKKKGVRELLEGRMEAVESAFVSCWQRLTGTGAVLESVDHKIK